jgi:hypothetical protein
MEIVVDSSKVGVSLEKTIQAKMAERSLPGCLGHLFPPIMSKFIETEDTELLAKTESLKDDEKINVNMMEFIVSKNIDITEVSLTKEGLEKIEKAKIETATLYVDRIKSCVECQYIDTCHKITQNYLQLIKLNEKV